MRLIDADELRKHALWECYENPDYDYQYVTVDQINCAPTIEAEPVDLEELSQALTDEVIAAHEKIGYEKGYRDGYASVIEAEPVRRGRWLIGVGENGEPIGTYCSECGWSWERNVAAIQLNKVLSRIETPRCPNCGAKMDEVEE